MPKKTTKKPWGQSRRVYIDDVCQVEHISVLAGGFSSQHHHLYKTNIFIVESGTLFVDIFNDKMERIAQHSLEESDQLTVEPGVRHQFFAATPVEAVEIYWGMCLNADDIVRFSENGREGDQVIDFKWDDDAVCCQCDVRLNQRPWSVVELDGAWRQICEDCRG